MSVIEDIRAGKKETIKEVYKENAKEVYNFAKSITGNHDTALDATKKTFVILFNNIQNGETPTNIRLSALKIAYDEACRIAMPSTDAINSPYDKETTDEVSEEASDETPEEIHEEVQKEDIVDEEPIFDPDKPPIDAEKISDLDVIETDTYFEDANSECRQKKHVNSDHVDGRRKKSTGLRTFFFVINIFLVLILIWFLFGLLQNLGIIPDSINIGHQWFNDTIYPIF